jgi:hypothetical protein
LAAAVFHSLGERKTIRQPDVLTMFLPYSC